MGLKVVVIGAGQAAASFAAKLVELLPDAAITIVGDEPVPPYQRPPLSKAYLKGELAEDRLFLKTDDFYAKAGIQLTTGGRVETIDPANRRLTLHDGSTLGYSSLMIATGTRARELAIEGGDLDGVFTLRGIDDTARIGEALRQAESVAIVGGGYIGMEFAAVARSMGRAVTVIETQERILKRSVAPQISAFLQQLHEARGVRLVLGQGIARIAGSARATGVELASGEIVPAELVLVAVGAVPAVEFAAAAGLAVERGIVVDAACRTSAPDIYAAGDCTVFQSRRYGRRIGLESVQNASDQARAAALSMLGEAVAYDPVPWFWSDQFDMRLQIAGLSQGYNRTERVGEPDEASFALRYFAGDTLLAVDAVNAPRLHMMARKELAAQDAPERTAA